MTYAQNFATLSKLVLILFSEDKTVVPKESAWFGSYSPPPEEGDDSEETLREKLIKIYNPKPDENSILSKLKDGIYENKDRQKPDGEDS